MNTIITPTDWNKVASVTRPGKFFYTAKPHGKRVTVCQSRLSGRWLVRENDRVLPGDWPTASEARRHAEFAIGFGRAL